MTVYSQGTFVLVRFPFTDQSSSKQRPAIVISADWFNNIRPDRIIVGITSQVPGVLERDEVALSPHDFLSGGLPKPSIVKLGKVVTVEYGVIIKPLGQLNAEALGRILRQVQKVLGEPARGNG